MKEEIERALSELPVPEADDGRATVREVGPSAATYVGVDGRAWAVLVLPPTDSSAFKARLPNLEFDPRVNLRLLREDGRETKHTAATIRAKVGSAAARAAFSTVAASLTGRLAEDPSFDYTQEVAGLREIFTSLRQAPTATDVVGLWGELLLIAHATNTSELTAAWHQSPKDVFDFSRGGERLEVKTTRDPARAHWLSLSQKRAAENATVTVISILVAETKDGASISDLIKLALSKLKGDLKQSERLLRLAAKTLGTKLEEAEERFDLAMALQSIRRIAFEHVPVVTADATILEARWRCSLADVPQLSDTKGRGLCELLP